MLLQPFYCFSQPIAKQTYANSTHVIHPNPYVDLAVVFVCVIRSTREEKPTVKPQLLPPVYIKLTTVISTHNCQILTSEDKTTQPDNTQINSALFYISINSSWFGDVFLPGLGEKQKPDFLTGILAAIWYFCLCWMMSCHEQMEVPLNIAKSHSY